MCWPTRACTRRPPDLFQAPDLTRDAAPATIADFVSGSLLGNAFEPVLRRREPAVEAVFAALAQDRQAAFDRVREAVVSSNSPIAAPPSSARAAAGLRPGWLRARSARHCWMHWSVIDFNAGASPRGPRHQVLILAFGGSNPPAPATCGCHPRSMRITCAGRPISAVVSPQPPSARHRSQIASRDRHDARRSQPAGIFRQRQPPACAGSLQGTGRAPGQGAGQRASPMAKCRSRSRKTSAGRTCS